MMRPVALFAAADRTGTAKDSLDAHNARKFSRFGAYTLTDENFKCGFFRPGRPGVFTTTNLAPEFAGDLVLILTAQRFCKLAAAGEFGL